MALRFVSFVRQVGSGLQHINTQYRFYIFRHEGGGPVFRVAVMMRHRKRMRDRADAAALIRNVGSTYAHSEGCLVLVMPCGSVVTGRDYSCAKCLLL